MSNNKYNRIKSSRNVNPPEIVCLFTAGGRVETVEWVWTEKFCFSFQSIETKQYSPLTSTAYVVYLLWSVTLSNSNENICPPPWWSATTNTLFSFKFITLLLPHFKTSESMAFSIYHVQIRPLTSIDSAIDTVTIPALPQYQVYIANISQQGENTSSHDSCYQTQCWKILHWKLSIE